MTEATQATDRMAAARAARAANIAAAKGETAPPAVATKIAEHQPTMLEKVAINQVSARERKIEALKAARASREIAADPDVIVRVTKRGAGKISMGEHIPSLGDLTYDKDETPALPKSVAESLESLDFVEIQ